MPLSIDNAQFDQFVRFAQQQMQAGKDKAVARADAEATGLAVRDIRRATDDRAFAFVRHNDDKTANNAVRKLFRQAISDMFGGKSRIPAPVQKAMLMADYDKGKPLTARRILAVKAAIDKFDAATFAENLPDTLDVDVGGETFTFDKWHYQRIVSNTPPAECPRSLDELRQLLSGRISHGREIIRDVLAGNGGDHFATPANVADLTLALHAAALRHGEKMQNGSFSVADPDGRLAQWLDTSQEVYVRASSHLKGYQKMKVDGHLNMTRGIDIPEGKNGLMAGMRTINYGTVPDLDHLDNGGSGPNRRLFLKCETFGARISVISPVDVARSKSNGMRTRYVNAGDFKQSFEHTRSYFATRGEDATAGGARKEHMTDRVKTALKTSVANLKAAGRKDLAAILEEGDVKKAGTRRLLHNLNKAFMLDPENAEMQKAAAMIFKAVDEDAAGLSGDLNNRLGNEIMIETEDLT